MLEHTQISEHRACRLVGRYRDSWRHPSQPDALTVHLSERIYAVALEWRRFGYRRVHDMLRTELPGTNHKKVFRLYREQGLAVRKRSEGKKYRGERTPLVAATRVNQPASLLALAGCASLTIPAIRGNCLAGAVSLGEDTLKLSADVQRRVLDHREAIGEDAAKLEYLQDYARQCWRATSHK